MNKQTKIILGFIVIIILIGVVTGLFLFSAKKQNQESKKILEQSKIKTEIKQNQYFSDTEEKTELINCGGKNYNAEIYNLEGVNVLKRIVQLLGKDCKFNITGNNIGIISQYNSNAYTIFLYDKDKKSGLFEDPSEDRVFVIDLNENTVSDLVDEFAGTTKLIGKFK